MFIEREWDGGLKGKKIDIFNIVSKYTNLLYKVNYNFAFAHLIHRHSLNVLYTTIIGISIDLYTKFKQAL